MSAPQEISPDDAQQAKVNRGTSSNGMLDSSTVIAFENSPDRETQQRLAAAGGRSEQRSLPAASGSHGRGPWKFLTRVGYNNGYGDLALGRFIDRRRLWNEVPYDVLYRRPKEMNSRIAVDDCHDFTLGSYAVPLKTMDGFIRSGSFRYSDLPQEIRNRVIYFLLEPCYKTCPQTKLHSIQVQILDRTSHAYAFALRPESNCHSMAILVDEPSDGARRAYCEEIAKFGSLSSKEVDADFSLFRRNEIINAQSKRLHPDRSRAYSASTFVRRTEGTYEYEENFEYMWKYRDLMYLDWLRKASNVNISFRRDMCSVFWSCVSLTENTEEGIDIYQAEYNVPALLADRPSAWAGIKSLHLKYGAYGGDQNRCAGEFFGGGLKRWCFLVAKKLTLDYLKLDVHVEKRELKDLWNLEYYSLWLEYIRKIRVMKGFLFEILVREEWWEEDNELEQTVDQHEKAYKALVKKVKARFVPRLRKALMPNSLRPQQPKDDMSRYLQSRLEG